MAVGDNLSSMWDMYNSDIVAPTSSNAPVDTSGGFDWSFDNIGDTVTSGANTVTGWLDSLANTYGKVQNIKNNVTSPQDDADKRAYEDITQKNTTSEKKLNISNENIMFIGAGCVALYLIFK